MSVRNRRSAIRSLCVGALVSLLVTAAAVTSDVPGEGREALAIAAPLVMAFFAILTLCYLATAGTRYWGVGVLGGLSMGWMAAFTVLMVWDDQRPEAVWRLYSVSIILTVALAQIALLLGVAGDRPRLRVVLWPTVALSVAATALAISLEADEAAATETEYRTFVVLAIVNALGTLITLVLALFGTSSPEEQAPLAARLTRDP